MCARTTTEFVENICDTKKKNVRQRQLLEAVFKQPRLVLHRAGLFTNNSNIIEVLRVRFGTVIGY